MVQNYQFKNNSMVITWNALIRKNIDVLSYFLRTILFQCFLPLDRGSYCNWAHYSSFITGKSYQQAQKLHQEQELYTMSRACWETHCFYMLGIKEHNHLVSFQAKWANALLRANLHRWQKKAYCTSASGMPDVNTFSNTLLFYDRFKFYTLTIHLFLWVQPASLRPV